MARDVADTAALLDVIARPDARDFMALPLAGGGYGDDPPLACRGLRLGLLLEAGVGTSPTAEVRAAIEAAAAVLAAEGAVVEPIAPPGDPAMLAGLDLFFRTRALTELLRLPPELHAGVLPFVRDWCAGAASWSAIELMRAIGEIFRLREAFVAATVGYDFVLSPTSPIPAYEAEAPCPGAIPSGRSSTSPSPPPSTRPSSRRPQSRGP
jgi:Asp-tRNA(Asn)/Glu-tRNA(Gln) amidotransferase A subunit family amidase